MTNTTYLINQSMINYNYNLHTTFYSKLILFLILGVYAFLCYRYTRNNTKNNSLHQYIIRILAKTYYISFFLSLPILTGFLNSEVTYWFLFQNLMIGYSVLAIIILIILFIFGAEYLLSFFTGENLQNKNEKIKQR